MPLNLETVAQPIVSYALAEDMGQGDITTQAIVGRDARAEAVLLAKAPGVIAGLDLARMTFVAVDAALTVEALVADGGWVEPGTEVARVSGPARGLLTGERVALNFVQRLSGVATLTRRYVEAVAGTGTLVLDTRKTTPALRYLEKYAVQQGGGANHRFGLFDMYLVKDNHVRAAGSLSEAVRRIRQGVVELPLEVEAQSLDEVREAAELSVDRVLLDNMDLPTLGQAIALLDAVPRPTARPRFARPEAPRWPEIEVSGGVTLESVRAIAELGVDYISVGALTHSPPALDLSLEITRLG